MSDKSINFTASGRSIMPLEAEHLPLVAMVHRQAFPDSALTRIGLEAIRRYYEWQLRGPHEHSFIGIFDQDKLVGFAVGGKARGALAGFVKRNKWFLAGQVISKPRLIFSPRGRKAIVSAWQAVCRFGKKSPVPLPGNMNRPPSFGILAIAVDPAFQGKGAGVQLMEHLEQIARERRFTRMHLTVSVNNAPAIRFYEKLSWTKGNADPVWKGFMEKQLS